MPTKPRVPERRQAPALPRRGGTRVAACLAVTLLGGCFLSSQDEEPRELPTGYLELCEERNLSASYCRGRDIPMEYVVEICREFLLLHSCESIASCWRNDEFDPRCEEVCLARDVELVLAAEPTPCVSAWVASFQCRLGVDDFCDPDYGPECLETSQRTPAICGWARCMSPEDCPTGFYCDCDESCRFHRSGWCEPIEG